LKQKNEDLLNTFDLTVIATLFGAVALFLLTAFLRHRRRLHYIDTYDWPPGLLKRLRTHHASLTSAEIDRIGLGLKQFFRAYLKGGRRHVAMPSQAADDLWHEFILYTKAYETFCKNAFGTFLHHTPAAALAPRHKWNNEGLRRVWWQACREEGIDPRTPKALPLLFALDGDLKIPGGYRYVPDCKSLRHGGTAGTQCGAGFSDSSIDGGTDGLGDSGGDGGDGGGCGGD
jgi:hypothetical protein